VGNITCDGPAQFYGHIEGEVRGSDLLIGEGADVVCFGSPTAPCTL
jgi:hypothetical protein